MRTSTREEGQNYGALAHDRPRLRRFGGLILDDRQIDAAELPLVGGFHAHAPASGLVVAFDDVGAKAAVSPPHDLEAAGVTLLPREGGVVEKTKQEEAVIEPR